MSENNNENKIRDIKTLLEVESFNTSFMAKVEEAKVVFLDEADNVFFERMNIIPFPEKNSVQYRFTLRRTPGIPNAPWVSKIHGQINAYSLGIPLTL